MSQIPQQQEEEPTADNPCSKFFSEIFTDEQERFMNEVDFNTFIEYLDAWLEEDEKINPDIARYMGYTLMGIANKLEGR